MKTFFKLFIYAVIGAAPTILADVTIDMWQWWVFCSCFWISLLMHDLSNDNRV